MNYCGQQQIFNRELEYFVIEITFSVVFNFFRIKKTSTIEQLSETNIHHDQISRNCLTVMGSSSTCIHQVNFNKEDLFYETRFTAYRRLNFIPFFFFYFCICKLLKKSFVNKDNFIWIN